MKVTPLVSVIIPVFDAELWLEECLESVCKQSYKNIEIIIIDDGSTDSSSQIYREYTKNDDRVCFFVNTSKGVSSARNMGIAKARGEFVLFVDSDDVIEHDYIARLVAGMNGADLAICGMKLCDLQNKYEQDYVVKNNLFPTSEFLRKLMVDVPFVLLSAICCKCYRREMVINNNFRFEENVSIGEDCLFNLSYLSKCNSVALVDNIGYIYLKRNNDSLTKRIHSEIFYVQTKILQSFLQLYSLNEISQEYVDVIINEWIGQVGNEIKSICKSEISREEYFMMVTPLERDIVKEIRLSSIKGFKKKMLLILMKGRFFGTLFFLLKYAT